MDSGDRARGVVAAAAERVRASYPGLEVEGYAAGRAPAAVLISESAGAALVVVGHRGTGGLSELHLNSVGSQVTAEAACPVIVVRGDPDVTGDVLLGIDATEPPQAAIAAAVDEAVLREVPLRVMYAWSGLPSPVPDEFHPDTADYDAGRQEAERLLAEALAGLTERNPGLDLRPEVTHSLDPATELVEASAGVGLVVVGRREISGLRRLLMGSVSRTLLHKAACPVLVARQPGAPPAD
jgi:nucleotide-binding universal stress UspA family protein